MKNSDNKNIQQDEMLEHYELDYSKAKPNRFAPLLAEHNGYIKLQDDVLEVFKNSEQVNNVLRAIISTYPLKKAVSSQ